jgi:hypothetical protein
MVDANPMQLIIQHSLHISVVQTISASAFAPASGSGDTYVFATAFSGDLVLWTLNPFSGHLTQRSVTAGMHSASKQALTVCGEALVQ